MKTMLSVTLGLIVLNAITSNALPVFAGDEIIDDVLDVDPGLAVVGDGLLDEGLLDEGLLDEGLGGLDVIDEIGPDGGLIAEPAGFRRGSVKRGVGRRGFGIGRRGFGYFGGIGRRGFGIGRRGFGTFGGIGRRGFGYYGSGIGRRGFGYVNPFLYSSGLNGNGGILG